MKTTISGKIISTPRFAAKDSKRITFSLQEDKLRMLGCLSAVDFVGTAPANGQNVTLIGEQQSDLISQEPLYFVFDSWE